MEMMEGDVMDKLEDMSSVYDFDPITGNIPATKVEITVSCRWVDASAGEPKAQPARQESCGAEAVGEKSCDGAPPLVYDLVGAIQSERS